MSEPTPAPLSSIDNLQAQVAKLPAAIEKLKELVFNDCEDCKRPMYKCACSEAVNANTAIKEG